MKSCTKTHACARRTRKRVGRILTMGEAHGTPGKAGQAGRAKPTRRLPFHVKPIPPCETSHAEQPLCHADYAAKGELPRAKQPPRTSLWPKRAGFTLLRCSRVPFAKHTVALRIRQLHNSASGLRIREVSRCVRLAVRLVRQQSISPRSGARENNFERLEIVAEKHWNIILE